MHTHTHTHTTPPHHTTTLLRRAVNKRCQGKSGNVGAPLRGGRKKKTILIVIHYWDGGGGGHRGGRKKVHSHGDPQNVHWILVVNLKKKTEDCHGMVLFYGTSISHFCTTYCNFKKQHPVDGDHFHYSTSRSSRKMLLAQAGFFFLLFFYLRPGR